MSSIETVAIDLSRGGAKFYLTSMTPDVLFKTAKVSRVNEDVKAGFQRTLDETRAKRISKYLSENKIIPGAIILSCQYPEKLDYDKEKGTITFPTQEGLFLVIDGQHRMYGSFLAKESIEDLKIPICILSGLSRSEEIQYFIDINSNQKGVPKTLRIELTKYLVEEDSLDGTRLKLFEDLNSDENSPFYGRLSSSQKGRGYITHVPFEISFNRLLQISPLKDLDYDKKYQLINNYTLGVLKNLKEIGGEQRLYQATFFQAIFRVFEKSCSLAITYNGNYKVEAFESIFEVLQKIDYDAHSGTNEQSITNLEKDIFELLELEMRAKLTQQDLF